jgi:hypothetical protein
MTNPNRQRLGFFGFFFPAERKMMYNGTSTKHEERDMANQLIKFRHDSHKGIFHYTVFEGEFVALSEIATKKIDYIKEHGAIDLTFDLHGTNYDIMAVDVIEDPEYVKRVYDYMQATENSYFNRGIEGLCVLRFHK